jgi:hypothetical protein
VNQNRNTINQIVFDKKTTLPYTAVLKCVPTLRFTDGYTSYGQGGGDYVNNPNTNAMKQRCKQDDHDRTFCGDHPDLFELTRCDELRNDAAKDVDPWYWKLVCQRKPWVQTILDELADESLYCVYVRGMWQGITGKFAVTTVTPSRTNCDLMP